MRLLHILLAEDNKDDVYLVRQALDEARLNYDLAVIEDGQKALDVVSNVGTSGIRPDVLLLDLNLPKVDGHTILSAFRANPATATTPVIVVTSSEAPSDLRRIREAGADRYFQKPTELREFLRLGEVVREVVTS